MTGDVEQLAERLRGALAAAPSAPPIEGDYPELRRHANAAAAVLVAITARPQPGVILTVRCDDMRTHAGQIAFPGGRIEAGETAVAAALREANEELILDPGAAPVVGTIAPYRTITGFVVTPVIAVIPSDLSLHPHEQEVADWFEAPLAFLLDPANQHRRSALFAGQERHYYEIVWNGRRIWGGHRGDDRQPLAPAAVAMKLDAAKWRKRRGLAALLDALGAGEGLTRYVGGAVRDDLMQLPVNDVDLATRLDPREVTRRLEAAGIKAVPTGIEHGTVTAVSDGNAFEVTTLRRDVSTDGRRATVAFTDDWREDAARRDFTINALSADPATGELFDYFGGLADLEARHVRFIGDPLKRIAEDHLRILRFFRFHARFGAGAPDPAALDACTARANDLMALSRERIADELIKLLALSDPAATVAIMVERGILKPVLPEIDAAGVAALHALIAAERQASLPAQPLRRLAALLPRDPPVAEAVAARLKLSTKARKRLACSAATDLGTSPQALAYRTGIDCAADRLLLAGRPADAAAVAQWTAPRLPIGGGALIARGLAQGPAVARTLRAIEDRWIEAGFPHGEQFERIVADCLAD